MRWRCGDFCSKNHAS